MSIVGQTRRFVTTRILSFVKPKHYRLFSFGLQALTFTPYESLGSNARLVVKNVATAASKMYRVASNKTLLTDFLRLVRESGLVRPISFVNVDFSTFCGFQTLCFGMQTGAGRAIPVWNASLTYPIKFVGSLSTLAQWIAWWVNGKRGEQKVHPKKKRSFFRIFWEELQRELRTVGLTLTVASVAPG